ncbi:hypothetical protein GCM10010404_19520 [Nonomuraea africana]|uniref:Uncharacterized protein n=1 Tax=Nonomuraea africana TaxID=46171 RepID=A0ABR9KUL8_9ACTN|nr:hypothetical protein [Nonomuraea africana]MBE1565212.1 hypothetical protein [Nonomuraea africana]
MRRAWLLVGGVFSLVSVVGLGSAFGFGMDLPEDSADTALISSRSTETTVSVYRIATTELFVDMKGEVDVKVVPVAGGAGRLTIERRLTWSDGGRNHSESWNGKWLRAEVSCAATNCGGLYTLTVPEGVTVHLVTRPRTLICPARTCLE